MHVFFACPPTRSSDGPHALSRTRDAQALASCGRTPAHAVSVLRSSADPCFGREGALLGTLLGADRLGNPRLDVPLPVLVQARIRGEPLPGGGALGVCRPSARSDAADLGRRRGLPLHRRGSCRPPRQRALIGRHRPGPLGRFADEDLGGHRLASRAQGFLADLPVRLVLGAAGGRALFAAFDRGRRSPRGGERSRSRRAAASRASGAVWRAASASA